MLRWSAAGEAVRGAGLLRVGREAAQARETGAAAQKTKKSFLAHYQHTKQKLFAVICSCLQLFALSRSAENKCRTFAL